MSEKKNNSLVEMSGAAALVTSLERLGVSTIFGYPGGANLPIFDALRNSKICHVLSRHEQGAAHMADGFARVANKAGVCLATSGPGATNLVTGLANAMLDSIPMVALSGQINRALIGTDAFQEVDCINITMPVTKHNELVTAEADLIPALESAFYIANSGRKGPVLLDLPVDILENSYPHTFHHQITLQGYNPTVKGNIGQIKKTLKSLRRAEKPLILFGGGISLAGAIPEFQKFIRATRIPVVRTLMGTGVVAEDDPQFLGMIGTHGNSFANTIIQKEADAIFIIGTRLGDRAIGKRKSLIKNATIIHLDIDPAEIGKNIPVDIPIVGDIRDVLRVMNERLEKKPLSMVPPWIVAKHRKTRLSPREGAFILEEVFTKLSSINEKLHVSTDVGRHQMWANHYCVNQNHLPLITSGGLGTMGFGLPAAIGAWFADRDTPVVNISGDGSFLMNMQEFVVAVEHKIPLTVIIVNDHRLSMIRELQRSHYGKRYTAQELGKSVNYPELARAMGGVGVEVTHKDQIVPALETSIASGLPTIIDLNLDRLLKTSHLSVSSVA